MKFSFRDLFLVTVSVALVLGWWVDHQSQIAWREEAETSLEKMGIELLRSGYAVGVGKMGIPVVVDKHRPSSFEPYPIPFKKWPPAPIPPKP